MNLNQKAQNSQHCDLMGTFTRAISVLSIIISLSLVWSLAQNCRNFKFPNKRVYKSCTDLPVLQAHLHWTYNSASATVDIAYRANQTPRGWVAWGINPTGNGMVGTQALVAFQDSSRMRAYTSPVTGYHPNLRQSSLSFPVSDLSAEYLNNQMIIYARLGPLRNGTTVNIVWQAGDSVVNGTPQPHPYYGPNIQSTETLHL